MSSPQRPEEGAGSLGTEARLLSPFRNIFWLVYSIFPQMIQCFTFFSFFSVFFFFDAGFLYVALVVPELTLDQDGLEFTEKPPASASWELELKVCTTTAQLNFFFFFCYECLSLIQRTQAWFNTQTGNSQPLLSAAPGYLTSLISFGQPNHGHKPAQASAKATESFIKRENSLRW